MQFNPELVLKFQELKKWRNKLWMIAALAAPGIGLSYYFYSIQNHPSSPKIIIESMGCSLAVLELFWSYYQGHFKDKKLPALLRFLFKKVEFIPGKDLKAASALNAPFAPERCRDFCYITENEFELVFFQVKRSLLRPKEFSGEIFQLRDLGEKKFDLERFNELAAKNNWNIQSHQTENAIRAEYKSATFLSPKLWGEVVDPQDIHILSLFRFISQ